MWLLHGKKIIGIKVWQSIKPTDPCQLISLKSDISGKSIIISLISKHIVILIKSTITIGSSKKDDILLQMAMVCDEIHIFGQHKTQ